MNQIFLLSWSTIFIFHTFLLSNIGRYSKAAERVAYPLPLSSSMVVCLICIEVGRNIQQFSSEYPTYLHVFIGSLLNDTSSQVIKINLHYLAESCLLLYLSLSVSLCMKVMK